MPLRVKNENVSPPGGWRWTHPISGNTVSGAAFGSFLEGVERTLAALGEDPEVASLQIHEETARALIDSGHGELVKGTEEAGRTAEQYRAGAKAAFLKWWRESPVYGLIKGKAGRGAPVFVDQEEAERRAAICTICQQNKIPASKTWARNWTDGKMLDAVEGRRTSRHEKLGACRVCSCELRAAVWWVPDIVRASSANTDFSRRFPQHCWKRSILDQTP